MLNNFDNFLKRQIISEKVSDKVYKATVLLDIESSDLQEHGPVRVTGLSGKQIDQDVDISYVIDLTENEDGICVELKIVDITPIDFAISYVDVHTDEPVVIDFKDFKINAKNIKVSLNDSVDYEKSSKLCLWPTELALLMHPFKDKNTMKISVDSVKSLLHTSY